MRWGEKPTFPLLHQMEGSLADNLSANFSLGISPTLFPDFETHEVLDTLQTISFVMGVPTLSQADKKAVSKAVYNIEHKLLSMEWAQRDLYAYHESQLSPLSYAFTLAALLYLEVMIREHPYISKVHSRISFKLQTLLSESNSSWYGSGSLPYRDVLLWIMFVKVVTSPPDVRDLCIAFPDNAEIEETMKESLRGRLKRIAWRDKICDYHLDRIWRELINHESIGP